MLEASCERFTNVVPSNCFRCYLVNMYNLHFLFFRKRLQILADESKKKKLLQSSGNRAALHGQPGQTFSMKLKALDKYILLGKYNSAAIDTVSANLPAVSTTMDCHPCKNSYCKKTNDGTVSFITFDKNETVVSQTFPSASTDKSSFSISDQEKFNNINASATMEQSLTCTPDLTIPYQKTFYDKAMEITTNRDIETPSENLNIQSTKISTKCQDGLTGYDEEGNGHYLHDYSVDNNNVNKKNRNLLLYNTQQNSFTGLPSAVNSCTSSSITENFVRHGSADDVIPDVTSCQCMHNHCCFAGAVNCKNVIQKCPCNDSHRNHSVTHLEGRGLPNTLRSNSCTVEYPRSSSLINHGKLPCRCSRPLLTACVCSHCCAGGNNIVKGTCYCQPLCNNSSTHLSLHGCNSTSLLNYTAGVSRSCEVATVACCLTHRDELVPRCSAPASLQRPVLPPPVRPPPHLLAAIALSELAAPAIK